MNNRLTSVLGEARQGSPDLEGLTPQTELRYLKHVLGSIVQDALNLWAELWAEFEGRVTAGVMVLPEAEKGFKPQCGWPEFLERMWQLRFYLASVKRFCEETP